FGHRGTWASSVTTAVAPLRWESGTFLATVSGADAITVPPHQGYLVRTQPNTALQGRKFGEFAIEQGARRVLFISPQTPFADSQFQNLSKAVTAAGGETGQLVYDDKKPSYRSEVDEIPRFEPDAIVLGGYAPDTTVMLKELYRAGYAGTKIAFAYAVNQQVLDGVPAEVVEERYTIAPSSNENSTAYQWLVELIGVDKPDPYTVQVYDQINLIIMAMAAAGDSTGAAIKDSICTVSQGEGGTKIDNALDGLSLIAQGKAIDYDGASGPCDFTPEGDIADSSFRYEQVVNGAFSLLKID
ncbi:MAG: ABC transporter substrate-binding protein, partial [Candidatus Devosia euplotis]|nr:ABC transporter substrate-binding protein [Candidatus Devosia euplotis]